MYIEKETGILAFVFLLRETSRAKNISDAGGYELVNLSHRDYTESKESCTALSYTHLHCVPYY